MIGKILYERRLSELTRGTHANARDNNAVQTPKKRAMTELHPRLPAKISRSTACNHVLTAAVARPNTFVPCVYRVFTSRVPRVPPAVPHRGQFQAAQNFLARVNFLPRITTGKLRLYHVIIATSKRPTASASREEILAEIRPRYVRKVQCDRVFR